MSMGIFIALWGIGTFALGYYLGMRKAVRVCAAATVMLLRDGVLKEGDMSKLERRNAAKEL
jgi:hypothetical protein